MADLRSAQWYGGQDRDAYIHRAWMRRGAPDSAFTGRPQIAIANTASDLVPCNRHLTEVAEHVAAGVWEAGGVPLDMPVVSLGETQVRPTAMLWRNMAAMAIEEMIRANPIDGVVLLGGCDKTIPALLMGAASVDLPAVVVPGGPMLTGTFRGVPLGCGTDVWRLSEDVRAGKLSAAGIPPVRVVDDPQPGALQHDGDRLHDGPAGRGARHDAARHGRPARSGQPAARPGARHRVCWPSKWPGRAGVPARCCRPPRSATRSWPWPHSAVRPMPSCTCSPSPGAWGYRSAWTISTASAPTCRCWSTCSPPGST